MKFNRITFAVLLAVLLTAGVASAQIPLLTASATTGAGTPVDFSNSAGVLVHVYSAAGSSGTVTIRGAMASTGPWKTLATITNPDATGEAYQGTKWPWISVYWTRSSGTVTAKATALSYDPGPWAAAIVNQTATAPTFEVMKFSITNAMVVALGASLTGDISIGTLPANARVMATYVNVTSAETSANALTVSLGTVSAAYVDWVVASDAKSVALYGDAAAERGATNIDGALLYTTATPVYSHFVKTTTNLSTCTAFAATVYVVYQVLP